MALELFTPDNFAVATPVFTDAGDGATARAAPGVEAYRRVIGEVRSLRQAGGAEVNSSNFIVEGDGGRYLLKRFGFAADQALAETRLGIQALLRERGVPAARVVDAGGGGAVVEAGGTAWCLQEFVEGDHFSGASAELAPTANAVGALLAACGELPAPPTELPRLTYLPVEELAIVEGFAARRSRWRAELGDAADALEEGWNDVQAALEEVTAALDDLRRLPPQITHIDLHPHNVLVRDAGVAAFVDFDSYWLQPAPVAAAFAAFKLVRQHAAREQAGDADAIAAAGASFCAAVAEHLGPVAAPPPVLCAKAEILRRVLDILGSARVWVHDLEKQVRALREVDVVLRDAAFG